MITPPFDTLSRTVRALLAEIGALADRQGVPCFLVGGMVRDMLLGVPSLDVDLVVEGDGIAFAGALGTAWGVRPLCHRDFGTAAIVRADGIKVDVVTARRETYARPGALPDVIPGQLSDDLFRRDFTVNAVACSLNAPDFGEIRDDFDGVRDIRAGLLRIMHYRSFIDDPTRILRAVRYEKRFAFRLEPRTSAALKAALTENAFRLVSPARYFGEFRRVLEEKDPRPALRRLAALDGLRFFVYDAAVEARFRSIVRGPAPGRWEVFFAALIQSLDRNSVVDLMESFNMRRDDKKAVLRELERADAGA